MLISVVIVVAFAIFIAILMQKILFIAILIVIIEKLNDSVIAIESKVISEIF